MICIYVIRNAAGSVAVRMSRCCGLPAFRRVCILLFYARSYLHKELFLR